MIRNTTGWANAIDRAVAREGQHGEHGGWSLAQDSRIYCACGDSLFEMAAVAGAGRPGLTLATPPAATATATAGQHVVVLGSHQPYHSSAAWILGDQESAERFAAFVTSEIDPAQVLKARSPVTELLTWRHGMEAVLAMALTGCTHRPFRTEQAVASRKEVIQGTHAYTKCPHCPAWRLERVQQAPADWLPAWMRKAIYKRDNGACVCCGIYVLNGPHSIGHRIRRSQGGRPTFENLLLFRGWGDGLTADDHHYRIDNGGLPEDEAKGYRLRRADDPLLVPVMLFSRDGSGVTGWPTMDGRWIFEAPAPPDEKAALWRPQAHCSRRCQCTSPPRSATISTRCGTLRFYQPHATPEARKQIGGRFR